MAASECKAPRREADWTGTDLDSELINLNCSISFSTPGEEGGV